MMRYLACVLLALLAPCSATAQAQWATGLEGQRKADLGNGTYLNPVMPGDHPDPSILKDGDDYYMTFSSFESYPGLMIWHSRDLVNWRPVGPALKKYVGSVWAPELAKHQGRYYLYIPAKLPGNNNIYVISADRIEGPWSEPVALNNSRIDPGHIVGEDGKRYLFLSHGDRVQLSDDGQRIVGKMEHVYDGWAYPPEWDVEGFAQEGPKMMKHGEYYYMTLALGGTAGPPTGHMVVSARSKSINGPWENSPYNPIARTRSTSEKWWSKGHATLVEGPQGDWYMMYHAYENGFYTLGRQTLLSPIEWTADGWFKARDVDAGAPIAMPVSGRAVAHGMALSDDFTSNKFGRQWSFFAAGAQESERLHFKNGVLELEAKGTSPSNSSPLTFIAGDQAYQFEVDIDFDEGAQAGALLFYNDKLYAGVGVNKDAFVLHRYGMDQRNTPKPAGMQRTLRMRVTNDRHILTVHTSTDGGKTWVKYGVQMEVSGYHHNVAYGFMSLRPALYAAGKGKVRFSRFVYRALSSAPANGPAWVADTGDGRYRNPVLHADYSDPDVIRVGDMFYMTSSSFSNVPGLPLLQSRDMVNWELVGHALPQLVPAAAFAATQPGKGVWAPCLRYHDGKFWIFYPDPDYGIYVMTAPDFKGPWSAPHLLLPGKGLIDPAPLWDDDGQAYLLHAWAKSRAGINNMLTLRRMAPDGMRMLDEAGPVVVDANKLPGYTTLEGPKFYKEKGYYYIFAPAGGVEFGWQSVFRARRIEGPYEDRIVMRQGPTTVNGPHQGAWVRNADGNDWFFHFQDKRAYGRVMHLQPMHWRDGWPVIGEEVQGAGYGVPVMELAKPIKGQFEIKTPDSSDEFDTAKLGLQWQWNANWDARWYSLTARPGFLRLYTQPAANGLPLAPSILTQKPPAEEFTVETRLSLNARADGERAGLIMLGQSSAWLELRRRGGQVNLEYVTCTLAGDNCPEQSEVLATVPAGATVDLRMQVGKGGVARFSYRLDGQAYAGAPQPFTMRMGRWVGAQMGLFSLRGAQGGGFAEVDWFRVTK